MKSRANLTINRRLSQSGFTRTTTKTRPKGDVRQAPAAGFTIIELLIATSVFSVILLLCATALIQVGRMYYKGITAAQTQEAARAVMDEVSRTIQFGGGNVIGPAVASPPMGTLDRFCIGDKHYSFLIKNQLSDNPSGNQRGNVLVVDDAPGCPAAQDLNAPGSISGTSRELLRPNMRLAKLKVEETSAGSNLFKIEVRVVYGDDDLLIQPPAANAYEACESFRAGTQFCAVSELSTVVKKRVK